MRTARDYLVSRRLLLGLSLVITFGVVVAFSTLRVADAPSPPAEDSAPWEYVALGDSYTTAPYVPPQVPEDPCLRSQENYPALLAAKIPFLELTDVSCGGATTADMTTPQVLGTAQFPPQFDALDEGTDLVTIGIGGNDGGFFGNLIYACLPGSLRGATCHIASPRGADLQVIVDQVQNNVRAVLDGIKERAPDARIIVVPYPQLLAPSSVCPERVPFDAADSAYISDVVGRLSGALMGAAEDAGVEYVDVLAASQGHDICSAEPWVRGSQTDVTVAASFHPLAAEQEAVAELLRERLCQDAIDC